MREKFVRIGEAARRIGVHIQTLRRWEREGRTPTAKRNQLTGQRIYLEEDIERLLKMISSSHR